MSILLSITTQRQSLFNFDLPNKYYLYQEYQNIVFCYPKRKND